MILDDLELRFRWTKSQYRQLQAWFKDCGDWNEDDLSRSVPEFLEVLEQDYAHLNAPQKRDWIFFRLRTLYENIAARPRRYAKDAPLYKATPFRFEDKELQSDIFRLCPAASDNAVCCNLQTLNIVDNCTLGCSYCFLQKHKDEAVVQLPTNLAEKLSAIQLDSSHRMRIGTGEYSDSLLWGNRNNILQDLFDFARKHKNIILELKTKTANISYLLENEVPPNVCCSWSLNPQPVIDYEEQGSASLDQRLQAARRLADKGVKVGFHLHPMIFHEDWEENYRALVRRLKRDFVPAEILWFSLGSITWIRGMHSVLRAGLQKSKALQMPSEVTPDNKITYSFAIREQMYRLVLDELQDWKKEIWTYLCMEFPPMWNSVLGYSFPDMKSHDDAFNASAFAKL